MIERHEWQALPLPPIDVNNFLYVFGLAIFRAGYSVFINSSNTEQLRKWRTLWLKFCACTIRFHQLVRSSVNWFVVRVK